MTGNEPHAPRGTAGRGPNWDRGPRAGHAGAVRSGTVGCGLNRDHWLCTGRGSYASTHPHLGTAGRETVLGSRAASGPEELRDSERTYVLFSGPRADGCSAPDQSARVDLASRSMCICELR